MGVYFQNPKLESVARKMEAELTTLGLRVRVERNAMRQMPSWANTLRYFHHEDAGLAMQLCPRLTALFMPAGTLKALDLTREFAGARIRPGSLEIWICNQAENFLLPKEPYEMKFEATHRALSTTIPDATNGPPDPEDEYCEGWYLADRSAFLDRQLGEEYQNDPPATDGSKFVFYSTPARHDHGAPLGTCGVRLKMLRREPRRGWFLSGLWESLEAGDVWGVWPGDHFCLFGIISEVPPSETNFQWYVIDDVGNILDQGPQLEPGEAIWVKHEGQEALWHMDHEKIILKWPDGKVIWSVEEARNGWTSCFSPDRAWAFRELTHEPARVAIYSVDGKRTYQFMVPFTDEKAQKGYLGLNDAGELVIRVNRRIYRVDHLGVSHLEAVLPVYRGRHRSIETTGPGIHFDVDRPSKRIITYEYATNISRSNDYPRPQLMFDINAFEAQESLDGGKKWRTIRIKSNAEPVE